MEDLQYLFFFTFRQPNIFHEICYLNDTTSISRSLFYIYVSLALLAVHNSHRLKKDTIKENKHVCCAINMYNIMFLVGLFGYYYLTEGREICVCAYIMLLWILIWKKNSAKAQHHRNIVYVFYCSFAPQPSLRATSISVRWRNYGHSFNSIYDIILFFSSSSSSAFATNLTLC